MGTASYALNTEARAFDAQPFVEWYTLPMQFWKSKMLFLGAAVVSIGLFFSSTQPAHAVSLFRGTYTATAPTSTLGTIRQVRVDPADGSAYVLGSVTTGLGVLSPDGSSFSSANYSSALPTHSGSDLAVSHGKAFIVLNAGSVNGVYRYDISGSTATFVASSTLGTGTSAITLGGDSLYVSKGTTVYTFDTNLTSLASNSSASSSISRLTYTGGRLIYLSTAGRFASLVLGLSDTTITSGGPSVSNAKGLTASSDGNALYYASNAGFSKLSIASSSSLLWTRSMVNVAGMDVNTSTGRITVITTSGVITSYDPITPVASFTSSASGTNAILNWDPNIEDSDFSGVTIRRSLSAYPTSATDGVAVTSSDIGTSLADSDLGEGTYYYSLFNQTIDGYYSSAVTSTVTIDLPPAAPTLAAEATGSTINLSWTAPADTASFVLRRDTTGFPATYTDGVMVTTTNSGVTSFTQTGVADGTYYYSIFAADAGGNYSTAGMSTVTIDTTAPSAPSISAVASSSTILLTWDTPATTASFLLRRSTSGFPMTISSDTAVTTTVVTDFVDAGLSDNIYYYSLFARDSHNNYSTAGTASAIIDTTAPSTPSNFSAAASGNSVYLTWSNPIDSDFSAVTIRRSTTDYPTSNTDGTAVTTTIATNYTDSSLTNNVYYYSLFAEDTTGNISGRATSRATVNVSAPSASVISGGGGGVGSFFVPPSTINTAPLRFTVSNGSASGIATLVSTPTVKLQLNADPATVRGYAASLDPTFKNASIFPLSPVGGASFTLPDQAGTYTVYLKYYSITGQSSAVLTQTVTYSPAPSSPSAPSGAVVATPIFTRMLRQGDRGADVKALQVFLNTHGFVITKTGQGSPGNETTFFGPATTKAVIKFQEAYKDTVLKPYNLQKGTGIFGVKMREVIESRSTK